MAEFHYGVRFEGSEIGRDLSGVIVDKIKNEKINEEVSIVKCQNLPGYDHCYKFNFPNQKNFQKIAYSLLKERV
jgi:hypothetical protein